jgi:hypothetical protein
MRALGCGCLELYPNCEQCDQFGSELADLTDE